VDDSRSASLLQRLSELERADADLGAAIERVAEVGGRADAVRARTIAIRALRAAMPLERTRLDEAGSVARNRCTEARVELEEAERRLASIERSRRVRAEQREHARRDLTVAREAVAAIEAQLTRISDRRTALDEDDHVLLAEGEGLVVAASEVAAELDALDGVSDSGRGAPGASPDELDEWGARAHAALFVVRGSLEARRESVVAEANHLAAAVLVDPLAAMCVADVRRHVDAALR
jgi:hypothetical protein